MSSPAVPITKDVNPLLAGYLAQLVSNPLRTKSITTAVLCGLQEVLGSHIARVPAPRTSKNIPFLFRALAQYHIDDKALKMAIYGALVSAPLSHVLIGALQRAFAGKTGVGARIGQILASNLLVAPVQTAAYLASVALVSGASSFEEIKNTVKAGFFPVLRITWIVSPLSLTIAQRYVPVHLWVPFFNLVQFVLGTVFNARVKKLKLAAAQKKAKEEESGEDEDTKQE